MRVLTPAQMRDAERRTIDECGVPSLHLMERAGEAVVAAVEAHVASRPAAATVLCGRGNNGGDGWVVARLLRGRGVGRGRDPVRTGGRGGRRRPREPGPGAGGWGPHRGGARRRRLGPVPAAAGGGRSRRGRAFRDRTEAAPGRSARHRRGRRQRCGRPVVAIDLPSGLLADLSRPSGPCPRATLTVTLGAPKLALALRPEPAGRVVVADIGIPAGVIAAVGGPRIELLTPEKVRPTVPVRPAESHKGDYGRVAIVAGSQGRAGAARLAGLGALRGGAGLVTVAAPASCRALVAGEPEYMTLGLPDEEGVATGGRTRVRAGGPVRRRGGRTGPGCRPRMRGDRGCAARPARPRAARAGRRRPDGLRGRTPAVCAAGRRRRWSSRRTRARWPVSPAPR